MLGNLSHFESLQKAFQIGLNPKLPHNEDDLIKLYIAVLSFMTKLIAEMNFRRSQSFKQFIEKIARIFVDTSKRMVEIRSDQVHVHGLNLLNQIFLTLKKYMSRHDLREFWNKLAAKGLYAYMEVTSKGNSHETSNASSTFTRSLNNALRIEP